MAVTITTMKNYWFSIIFICLLILKGCVAPVLVKHYSEKIDTKKGKIRGVIVEFPRDTALRTVKGYFEIPFASGSLRFMPPSEVFLHSQLVKEFPNSTLSCPQLKWHDRMFEGSDKPKGSQIHFYRIMQSTKKQHESCLVMNIFVPTKGK